MVFQELAPAQAHKAKTRDDLEADLFITDNGKRVVPKIRDNEGEAAEYGVYYDDTEYDYMQHMRDLHGGGGDGQSYFVEASLKKQGKGKVKIKLEDALRAVILQEEGNVASQERETLFDEEILPSRDLKKRTYQDQQDVPDALAGFQPGMDPRLREVLEA